MNDKETAHGRGIDHEALETMRSRGERWYAYQNLDFGHPNLGHLQFLQVGKGRTFEKPPKQMPDTAQGLGYRYKLIGHVDLAQGLVVPFAD